MPILVYHHVLPRRRGPRLLYVRPSQFSAELACLQRLGYRPVTLRRVYDAWFGRDSLPRRPVVITFDDGYIDQVRRAAALLRRHGWPAELDLIFDSLYRGSHPPSNRVTVPLVRRLLDDGWELESHSVSHPDLTSLSGTALRHQLEYSRTRLGQVFGVPVDFLCYPGGDYNARVERAARRAGYLAATSTDFGAGTPRDLYALPRIYCYWGESLSVFKQRLERTVAAAR